MAVDLIRQRNGFVDIFCCFRGERVLVKPMAQTSPVTYYNGDTIEMNKKHDGVNGATFDVTPTKSSKKQKCTLTHFVRNIYAPIIQKLTMKVSVFQKCSR